MSVFPDPASSQQGDPNYVAGRRIDWTLRDVGLGALGFVALFVLLPIPVTLPFLISYGDDSRAFYAASLIVTYGSQAGLVAVAAMLTFRKYGGSWDRLGFQKPTWATIGWAGAGFAGAIALGLAYGLIIQVFDISALKSQCDDQLPSRILNDRLLLVLAGVAVIGFAPVCEEVFFRGFSFTGIARAWGIPLATAASALLWSSAHASPAIHKTLIPIFLIGLVFAITYVKSGNIFSTILAHMAYNVIGFVAITGCDA